MPHFFHTKEVKELLTLAQMPNMPVIEYNYKFDELSKYEKVYTPDKGSKAERFWQDLMANIGAPLISIRITTYNEMKEEVSR